MGSVIEDLKSSVRSFEIGRIIGMKLHMIATYEQMLWGDFKKSKSSFQKGLDKYNKIQIMRPTE